MGRVILFGATSEIGLAILNHLPEEFREEITLVGSVKSGDLMTPKLNSRFIFQDWSDLGKSQEMFSTMSRIPEQDLVIISLGYASQEKLQYRNNEIQRTIEANLLWPLLCLESLALNQKMTDSTQTIFISSSLVSLPTTSKSLVYTNVKKSAEKIIKKEFAQGNFKGRCLLVRPGYIPTKLNFHLTPGSFASTPDEVAKSVMQKIGSGQANGIMHAPLKISFMAGVSRMIPKPILKRILEILQM